MKVIKLILSGFKAKNDQTRKDTSIMSKAELDYTMFEIKQIESCIDGIYEMIKSEKAKKRDSIEQAVFQAWLSSQMLNLRTFERELKEWKDSAKSGLFLGYN